MKLAAGFFKKPAGGFNYRAPARLYFPPLKEPGFIYSEQQSKTVARTMILGTLRLCGHGVLSDPDKLL
jgi:hypothetical protein